MMRLVRDRAGGRIDGARLGMAGLMGVGVGVGVCVQYVRA